MAIVRTLAGSESGVATQSECCKTKRIPVRDVLCLMSVHQGEVMRLNSKFAALTLTTAIAACGGGSNPPPIIIDSPDEVDTPSAVVCPVLPDIQGLFLAMAPGPDNMGGTADDVPLGANVCNPGGNSPCDWFQTYEMGGNATKNGFFLLVGLPEDVDNDPTTTTDNLLGVEFSAGA